MPEFGKVAISNAWLIWKGFLLTFMTALLFSPLIFFVIPVLICLLYLTVHEFIHAAAIIRNGGIWTRIYLGIHHCYIDFQMPNIEAERAVYGWGVFADLIVMILLVISLAAIIILTNSVILEMWGIMIIVAFTLEGILPKHSDLNEYAKRSLQKV